MKKLCLAVAILMGAFLTLGACSGEDGSGSDVSTCVPGELRECPCLGTANYGVQVCNTLGRYETCQGCPDGSSNAGAGGASVGNGSGAGPVTTPATGGAGPATTNAAGPSSQMSSTVASTAAGPGPMTGPGPSTTAPAATSTGSGGGCPSTGDCITCAAQACAEGGACAADVATCAANTTCKQIMNCTKTCGAGDYNCMMTCEAPLMQADMNTQNMYFAVFGCKACTMCKMDCSMVCGP